MQAKLLAADPANRTFARDGEQIGCMRRRGSTHRVKVVAGVGASLALLTGPAALALPGSAASPGKPGTGRPPAASTRIAAATETQPSAPVTVDSFDIQPVVLTGADFPGWTSGPEATARLPQAPTDYGVYDTQGGEPAPLRSDCYQSNPHPDVNGSTDANHGDHNCFQGSQLPVRTALKGVPAQGLIGYRWTGSRFMQIPFQVDTKWEHYISNNASGFAFYSGVDEMLTYTFDYEPFRFTSNPPFDPSNPTDVCQAQPPAGQPYATPDPNPALIDTDELSFMARDSGPQAPPTAPLPKGITQARQVELVDPTTHITRYVYVMESAIGPNNEPAVAPAYNAANSPYVRYRPGAEADMFAYAQSNYSDYGNAPVGPVCSVGSDGLPHPSVGHGFKVANGRYQLDPSSYVRRRTLDTAAVSTPRYAFTYGDSSPTDTLAGRWIMDGLRVSPDDKGLSNHPDYGPSIIDRFKGRAFQQSPGGDTPCCGYEDEQVNWNGSSVTMGVRLGPVRDIRVTWGSDSGTNVTRTDVFYAYSIDHEYNLRVHPIPPLDGIYTQWNMNAGAVTTYYNPENPKGAPITGINPVLMGDTTDFIGPTGVSVSSNDKLGRAEQQLNGGKPVTVGNPDKTRCSAPVPVAIPQVGSPDSCVYGSFNTSDPTFSGAEPALLQWEELTGPAGTMVEKWSLDQNTNQSPGGVQALAEAVPYYVDDSCFDDGTGNSPGPQVNPRNLDPTTWGFADQNGQPVAVSPAPAPADRYPRTVTKDGQTYNGATTYQRRCWNHNTDGTPYNIPGTATYDPNRPARQQDPAPDPNFGPQGDVRYFEGDIATHGLHLLFTSDSDNANLTAAVDEIDSVDHQVILPPDQPNVGNAYSAQYTTPIETLVTSFGGGPSAIAVPQPYLRGSGVPSTPISGTAGTGSSEPNAPDNLLPGITGPVLSAPGIVRSTKKL